MNIGDLLLSLIADGSQLTPSVEKEAAKAGDAGAKTLSQRMSAGLKTNGIKALGGAFAAAGAIATQGALQMEDAVARIRSETGATADEAERIAKTSNRIAGDQQQSLQSVTDVAIAVRKDMGLVGDELDKVTEQTVKYARVTKQDGVGAVKAMDDIGDAWNLTADQMLQVQGELLVSNQKWGGSITDNQDALAKLAPQMQALGASVDDTIALLNLFSASGLDSTKALAAMNTAVTKLKPGQSLNDLIKQVSSIEDPTLRAKKAIELFGAKGGVALANVLKPGITSLDQFGVSAEDSSTAVDDSVDALDSSLGGRLRKIVSQAKATLRGFGFSAPAITALGSLASLGATILPTGLLKAAGKKGALALVDGFKSAEIGTRLETLGLKAQTLWIKGMTKFGDPLVSALSGALASAWGRVMAVPAVASAVSAAGGAAGALFAAGVVAVPIVITALVWQFSVNQEQEQQKNVSEAVARIITAGSLDGMKKARDELIRRKTAFDKGDWFHLDLLGDSKAMQSDIDALGAAIDAATAPGSPFSSAVGAAGEHAAAEMASGVTKGAPAVTEATVSMVDDATAKAGYAANKKAYALGQGVSKQTAQGMLDAQTSVHDAFHSFLDIIKNAMSPAKEQARLLGNLTSRKLREGLQSGNPIVRKAAEEMQTQILDRLEETVAQGKPLGKDAARAVANGLKSKSPEVRASAQLLAKVMEDDLARSKGPAGNAGQQAGQAYANRLRAAIARSMAVAIDVRAHFNTTFDNGHGHAVGGWAPAGIPTWVNEHTNNPEMIVPSVGSRFLTHADAVHAIENAAGGGGTTYQIPVTVQGALPVRTAMDIAREVRRAGVLGLPPPRELSPKYHRREATKP